MAESYNGWLASPNPQDFGGLDNRVVPGTEVKLAPGVRAGDVATVLFYVAAQLHARVEPAGEGCWGYNFRKNRNANNLSCHGSATAFDWDAPKHPNGRKNTFTPAQVAEIRAILKEVDGVVAWGGDFTGTKDEMHWEICGTPAQVAKVAQRLNGTYPPPLPKPKPKPRPKPAPAPVPAPAPDYHEVPLGGVVGLGARGAQVTRDQRDLLESGFSIGSGAPDGYAGPGTVAGIKSAQQACGITVDGEMGNQTRTALHSVPAWATHSTLKVQQRLNAYGNHLLCDGKSGPKTAAAIKDFQGKHGLSADGLVGPMTWTALYTR